MWSCVSSKQTKMKRKRDRRAAKPSEGNAVPRLPATSLLASSRRVATASGRRTSKTSKDDHVLQMAGTGEQTR